MRRKKSRLESMSMDALQRMLAGYEKLGDMLPAPKPPRKRKPRPPALVKAVQRGDLATVRRLLGRGADVNTTYTDPQSQLTESLLTLAAENGRVRSFSFSSSAARMYTAATTTAIHPLKPPPALAVCRSCGCSST